MATPMSKLIAGKTTRLVALGAFYKNDVPAGFGLQTFVPDEAQQIGNAMETAYRGFKRSPLSEQRRFLASVSGQLTEASRLHKLGNNKITIAEQKKFIICGACNVYILEQEGILQPDEFNGCIFNYDVTA
jgi:hypothetical protein